MVPRKGNLVCAWRNDSFVVGILSFKTPLAKVNFIIFLIRNKSRFLIVGKI